MSGRLADNGAVLLQAYRTIAKTIDEGRAITPAAEWLVDNYYLVEREIRDAGRRTLTVTWNQLDARLAALSASVRQLRPDIEPGDRLAELANKPKSWPTLQPHSRERGDDTGADMLFWMTAARRSIENHRRDIGQSPEAAAS